MDLENLNKTVLGQGAHSKEPAQQFTFNNIIEEGSSILENETLWKVRKPSQGYCGTPDEQCDLDFDSVEGKVTYNKQ